MAKSGSKRKAAVMDHDSNVLVSAGTAYRLARAGQSVLELVHRLLHGHESGRPYTRHEAFSIVEQVRDRRAMPLQRHVPPRRLLQGPT